MMLVCFHNAVIAVFGELRTLSFLTLVVRISESFVSIINVNCNGFTIGHLANNVLVLHIFAALHCRDLSDLEQTLF